MNEKDRIHRMALVEGKRMRQVARETGWSPNTVIKLLENSAVPRYRLAQAKPASVLGPFKELIDQWVTEDKKKPKMKRWTDRRLYDILRAKPYGCRGAASTLRR